MATLKQVMKGPNEIVPFDHPFIKYPQFASQKYDGFRCLNLCGERLLSPALKDIPNKNLAKHFEDLILHCFELRVVTDGEIWSPKRTFTELQSIVRSHATEIPDDVGYYVFDLMTEQDWDNGGEPIFEDRELNYQRDLKSIAHVFPVAQRCVLDATEAEDFFNTQIALEHEGMILRQPNAKYKHGRCTTKQDGMWKFKQFLTHDAVIVGIEEQMRLKEGVERTYNEIGKLERRYEQDLYEPAGKVGAFVVVGEDGLQFKIKPGKGQNDYIKTSWWRDWLQYPEKWRGKHIEFKSMPHGMKDKPRIGSLVRFRPDLD